VGKVETICEIQTLNVARWLTRDTCRPVSHVNYDDLYILIQGHYILGEKLKPMTHYCRFYFNLTVCNSMYILEVILKGTEHVTVNS